MLETFKSLPKFSRKRYQISNKQKYRWRKLAITQHKYLRENNLLCKIFLKLYFQ